MRVAVLQFQPADDPAANAVTIVGLAAEAAADGADLVLAPEGSSVNFLSDPGAAVRTAQPLDGRFGSALVEASRRLGIAIAAGTFVPDADTGRVHNTLLVAQNGGIAAAYRKVHLYDAFSYLESDTVSAGTAPPPVVEIAGLHVGFATCYDLRFPELFRLLRSAGADVLALASAWVVGPLKEEHWQTLLRARAIENTCYVVAADQVGPKAIGRSAGIDPMGLPLLDLGTAGPTYGMVDISSDRVREVRRVLPAVEHIRFPIDPAPIGLRTES